MGHLVHESVTIYTTFKIKETKQSQRIFSASSEDKWRAVSCGKDWFSLLFLDLGELHSIPNCCFIHIPILRCIVKRASEDRLGYVEIEVEDFKNCGNGRPYLINSTLLRDILSQIASFFSNNHRTQSFYDKAAWTKPPVDIDLKVAF